MSVEINNVIRLIRSEVRRYEKIGMRTEAATLRALERRIIAEVIDVQRV